jgi:hypothetical protein
MTGYAMLTAGPMHRIDLHGRNHGDYWLLKAPAFHAELDSVSGTFTGAVAWRAAYQPSNLPPELWLEETRQAKPAVIDRNALHHSGTGFFGMETGVIAANAHVARGETSMLAVLLNGAQLNGKVVYSDAESRSTFNQARVTRNTLPRVYPCASIASSRRADQGDFLFRLRPALRDPGRASLSFKKTNFARRRPAPASFLGGPSPGDLVGHFFAEDCDENLSHQGHQKRWHCRPRRHR